MAKRCEHKTARLSAIWNGTTTIVTYRCWACAAIGIRSLGPANDYVINVQREMRAAELIAWFEAGTPNPLPSPMTNAEADGFRIDEASEFSSLTGWHIGYLARHAVADDGTGWEWDVTRPVAGQFEEWLQAKQYTQDKALRREAYKANEPARVAARAIFDSWPDDNTPTPNAVDEEYAVPHVAELPHDNERLPDQAAFHDEPTHVGAPLETDDE